MIGSQDILIGLVVVIFLFGAKKLPELAASLGKSMKEFKKATTEEPEKQAAPEPVRHPVVTAKVTCAACHAPIEADWAHCPHCGGALPASSTSVSSQG